MRSFLTLLLISLVLGGELAAWLKKPNTHFPTVLSAEVRHSRAVVIRDFFPIELADLIHSRFVAAWANSAKVIGKRPPPTTHAHVEGSDWVYTTNQGNKKTRSNEGIAERQKYVSNIKDKGGFAYSKWELLPTAEEVRFFTEYMELPQVRQAIAAIPEVKELFQHLKTLDIYATVDLFATAFIKNSFLTWHDDSAAGSMAFILSLAKDWEPQYGGTLEFQCKPGEACPSFVPHYNSVVLFCPRVEPVLPHQVTEVVASFAHQRYAFTGWYFVNGDHVDDYFLSACQLMRGDGRDCSHMRHYSAHPVDATFVNSMSEPLSLYWGSAKKAEIAPGKAYTAHTWEHHLWTAKTAKGVPLWETVLTDQHKQSFEISHPPKGDL